MQFLFSDHVLDIERRELHRGATAIAVEPQVFDLLVYLVENRDRVVSKDDLIASVWGGRIVSDSTVASRINAVRKALGDSGHKQALIRTVPRRGLRFVGAVSTRLHPESPSIDAAPAQAVWSGANLDAQSIEPHVCLGDSSRAQGNPSEGPGAWDFLMHAVSQVRRVTREDHLAAQALLEKAIAMDPSYGRALAVLAVSYVFGTHMKWEAPLVAAERATTRTGEDVPGRARLGPSDGLSC